MAIGDAQFGDIGTIFLITVTDGGTAVDISSATGSNKSILLMPPDGTVKTKTATFTGTGAGDGTDGQMLYTTIANDLDEIGEWSIQGKVILTAGTFYTEVQTFRVLPSLS